MQYTAYAYSPVGAFAQKRGPALAFMDVDGNREFDPSLEASGRCDTNARQCKFDHYRLRLLTTAADCSGTAGTWIIGDVYDHSGLHQESTLCDVDGVCSEAHQDVFQNMNEVNAIWIPETSDKTDPRTLTLHAKYGEVKFKDVELPQPLSIENTEISESTDLHVTITADRSIDMASLKIMQGLELKWISTGHPETFHANGSVLKATVPRTALNLCGDKCAVYLQIAHV